jgi:hypothetical protein
MPITVRGGWSGVRLEKVDSRHADEWVDVQMSSQEQVMEGLIPSRDITMASLMYGCRLSLTYEEASLKSRLIVFSELNVESCEMRITPG